MAEHVFDIIFLCGGGDDLKRQKGGKEAREVTVRK